jgi:hypothetical protein
VKRIGKRACRAMLTVRGKRIPAIFPHLGNVELGAGSSVDQLSHGNEIWYLAALGFAQAEIVFKKER